MNFKKTIVIFLPIVLLLMTVVIGMPQGDRNAYLCLLLMGWMVVWWIFEVLPLGITALIPLCYLPLMQIMPIKQVSPFYANPVIYLFLGGFMIARALEKTKLDERIALKILSVTGRSDLGIITGFIISTAFLSMWISNTATTVMMVPIALSVIHFLKQNLPADAHRTLQSMTVVLFLAIAYSANIGGIMTPIGTPPNVVFMGYLDELYTRKIDFWKWSVVTTPVAIVLLAIMLYVLRRIYRFAVPIPPNFKDFIEERIQALGRIDSSQKVTVAVFLLAASLWISKGLIHYLAGSEFLNDTSIAILAGILLFLVPTNFQELTPVLDRKDIAQLPWNIVLLFGGGMALAGALKEVGLIQMITEYFTTLDFVSPYWLIAALAAIALFLTEVMSNVALCVVALPMIMKLGEAQGLDPVIVAMPAALCASFAFSMPISTPPNAIVFGTHTITVKQMLKAGILLNFIALAIVMTLGFSLMKVMID
ncbi:DASS family sodium-coupled anion symporter [Methylomarinum sp. Ch1-1]|uniref:DASS family sodium-coupled anion symporter n=1 Tax=Methylomarinum roseum TaxID=3067653 RepID=A0AAU7NU09_9GAMM|nr:DASS family sodium-coupled anion symporter [Methylomarinum sp. Ch1-1]MDP4519432.1 DASS family sodium-coupled anion symporter [Methylomarinum sp. Ch1-1]